MNIDLRDPDTWAKFERQAYDGTLDLKLLPPAAYKYFAELAAVYYAFRFKGLTKEDAQKRKALLLKEYQQNVDDLRRARVICAEWQKNVKKSELKKTEIEKENDTAAIACIACEIIEELTGEDGFADRQKRKIGGIEHG